MSEENSSSSIEIIRRFSHYILSINRVFFPGDKIPKNKINNRIFKIIMSSNFISEYSSIIFLRKSKKLAQKNCKVTILR